MQIQLYVMHFDSTGVTTVLLSSYAVVVSETWQEPWRSLTL